MAEPNAPTPVTGGRIVSATGKPPARPEAACVPPRSAEAIPLPPVAAGAPQPRPLSVAVGVTAIVCLLALTILGALLAFDRWKSGKGAGTADSSPDTEAIALAPPSAAPASTAAALPAPPSEPERLTVAPKVVEPQRTDDARQRYDATRAAAVAAAADTQPQPTAEKSVPEPKDGDPLERRPVERVFPDTTKPPEKEKVPAGLPLGAFGTRIPFERSMVEAQKQAKDQNKLVLVMQLAGDFEQGRFTDARTDQFRREVLGDDGVVDYVSEHFTLTLQKPPGRGLGAKWPGVVCYFCAADGGVLHMAIAPGDAAALLAEARWAVETRLAALDAATTNGKPDLARCRSLIRKWHLDRFRSEYDPDGLVAEQTKELKKEGRKLGLPGFQNPNRLMGWFGMFVPFTVPPPPPKPKPIPESMPAHVSDRAKVHWLLQANINAASLPPVGAIAPLVWQDILKAK
jgi:hypothetical protein